MANEVEKKFILKESITQQTLIDEIVGGKYNPSQEMFDQLYIADGENTVRVRIAVDAIKKSMDAPNYEKAYLTVKGKSSDDGLERPEIEFEIPMERAEELKKVAIYSLQKERVCIFDEKTQSTIEIDFYKNELQGLITLEIEYPDRETAERSELPDFIKEYCEEVTGNHAYSNNNLARHGLPQEKKLRHTFNR